ncbi:MAG: LEA type 2 family protein [Deltaproteobacteria bacterium]|nr:LEA type 2 family protein [Deltaproteobacteria bacterium]
MTRARAPLAVLVVVALGAALGAAACIPTRFVRFEAREVRALKVTSVREEGVDAVLTAEVENPNPLAARIHYLRYRIFVGERLIGVGERGGDFAIAAKGRAVVDLPVRVRFADLPADLPALLSTPEVAYRAEVAVDATSRLGKHHFDLDRRGKVRVADAMKLTLAGDFALKVVQPRGMWMRPVPGGLAILADVEVRNIFPFPLEVRRVEYAVSLGGAHLADGRHERPIALGARATGRVEMELRVPLAAVPDVLRAVARGGWEARVRGRAHIRPISGIAEVPFDVRVDQAMLKR